MKVMRGWVKLSESRHWTINWHDNKGVVHMVFIKGRDGVVILKFLVNMAHEGIR